MWWASSEISLLVCPRSSCSANRAQATYSGSWRPATRSMGVEIGNKRFLHLRQTFRNDLGTELHNYFLEVSLPPEQSRDLANQPRWMWECRDFSSVSLGCGDVCRHQAW